MLFSKSVFSPVKTSMIAIIISGLHTSIATAQEAPQAAATSETPSVAQTNPVISSLEPRRENGRQLYDANVFARFAPQTARDMVSQIPGFTITELSEDRGLGEASQNVLINGSRISGKSNDARSVLSRISAASVIRLEIVDGATLDIAGLSGQVLNVVTKPDSLSGNYNWNIRFRDRIKTNPFGGEVNLSGKLGAGNFTLGLANKDSFRGGGQGPEVNIDKDGNLLYTRDRVGRFQGDRPTLSATYGIKSSNGAAFNVSVTGQLFFFRGRQEYDRFSPTGPRSFELSTNQENEYNYELSTDYEAPVFGGKLKLIAFNRFEHSENKGEFSRDTFGLRPIEADRFDQVVDEGEAVVRGEYRWKSGKNDWQISLESAKNFLDSSLSLFERDNAGIFQPVVFDGANARVVEKRGQLLGSIGRPLAKNVTMQLSLGGEYSQLRQIGANGLTRSFWRPKGSVSFSWKASPKLDASLKIQRKVGQLNFGDFLSSVDLQNSNGNAGNPELVPPQTWVGELELNRSLGKSGSIKAKFTHELISDLVDQVPITATTEAPGNIPSARLSAAELNASILLDQFGLKGAKIDIGGFLLKSNVVDLITRTGRPISEKGDYGYSIEFRHDIPRSNWAYGAELEVDRSNPFYRLNYTADQYQTRPNLGLYIENKNIFGLKMQARMNNVLSSTEQTDETFYVARRDGPVSRFAKTNTRYGFIYRFQVSGTF
jgi:outer membrane receptor for ferrienterochelin and colicins